MIAYDAPLGTNTRAGLGLGYAQSVINGNMYGDSTDVNSYQTTAYIGHERGPWFIRGSASMGWNDYSSERPIVFPGVDRTANAHYSGQDYTVLANTGYHISAPQKFTVTPLASLQYSRVNIDGYTETDAGDIDLQVQPQGYDFVESGLGTKVERDFSYHGWMFVPEVHAEWLYELNNPALDETAKFTAAVSPSFTTPGLKTDPDMFHMGAGLTVLSCACSTTKMSLEAGYDYYWTNDSYSVHEITMRFADRF